MTFERVPYGIRLLATRAAVGPDIEVVPCGDTTHFRFHGQLFLTRKGYSCKGYDSTVRHYHALAVKGKMDRYSNVCKTCKQLILGGA